MIPTDEQIWIAHADRGERNQFVVQADEKLTAFLELKRAVCIHLIEGTMINHSRSDGCKRYIVCADKKLTAFLKLESRFVRRRIVERVK